MRFLYCVVAREKELYDLVIVVVRGENERSDIGRELALLFRTKKRITLRALRLILSRDIVRVLDDDLSEHTIKRILELL